MKLGTFGLWIVALFNSILMLIGLFCFLVIFAFRADTEGDFDFKRHCAATFIFIWPLIYLIKQLADLPDNEVDNLGLKPTRSKFKRVAMGTVLTMLLTWAIAVALMQLEFNRLTQPEKIYKPFGI
jgi:hypothetical protein